MWDKNWAKKLKDYSVYQILQGKYDDDVKKGIGYKTKDKADFEYRTDHDATDLIDFENEDTEKDEHDYGWDSETAEEQDNMFWDHPDGYSE